MCNIRLIISFVSLCKPIPVVYVVVSPAMVSCWYYYLLSDDTRIKFKA